MSDAPLIEMKNISKTFGAVKALQNVNFEVMPAEIVGLVGDNAAGKSTLMKILSGAYIADQGEIWINGKKAFISNPVDSRNLGIEMLYQNFALAGNINIYQNIFLGRELTKNYCWGLFKILNKKEMATRSVDLISRLKIDVHQVNKRVKELSGGQQQSVAIARVIGFNARLIIMDEPTANLGIKEVGRLLDLIRRLREQGISVIVISHRLDDIFSVGDKVIVLKRGRRVGMRYIKETTEKEVLRLIVGGEEGEA
ncbi:MAG TPA: ATP-binding cassette domain-containing protein [Thermodesulfobacteriota bacterium]|nr:ATP-binding cassette domain-containing protein [Thermodesulfobacteriota bacterium]